MRNRLKPSLAICALVPCIGCGTSSLQKTDPFGYRQLTKDGGETGSPSLSRDGKFVVYASDRASPGNLDIWVQAAYFVVGLLMIGLAGLLELLQRAESHQTAVSDRHHVAA